MFNLTKANELIEKISSSLNLKENCSLIYRNFFLVFFSGLIINNLLTINQRIFSFAISPDEIENSHNAWSVLNKMVVYKDFFDSKGPLFTFINSFLISISDIPASFGSLIFLRIFHFSSLCLIGILIFLIARQMKLSLNASLLSVAILYMWDVVSTYGHEIRPEGLQTLFMLLGFYLFIKYYKETDKKLPFILVGLCFGLMFFIGFKSLAFLVAFFLFSVFEIFTDKDSGAHNKFISVLMGFLFVLAFISLYFLVKGGFKEFQFFYFTYNLDLSAIPEWTKKSTADLMNDFFMKKDIYLSLLSLMGLFTLCYSETKNRLMLICLLTTLGCYFIGFYPTYSFIFLPFCSILASSFVDHFFLGKFYESSKISIRKVGILFALYLLFLSSSGNFLEYKKELYTVDIKNQEINLDWVLINLPRSEEVAISKHACPAYIFNKDIRYFRRPGYHESLVAGRDLATVDLFHTIEEKNSKHFFAYQSELDWTSPLVKEFLETNFTLLKLVEGESGNCVWTRKKKAPELIEENSKDQV